MGHRRAAIALSTSILWAALAASAHAGYRRAYVVTPGDSLWRIARAHRCPIGELRRANRLAGTTIRAGQRLSLPIDCARPPSVAALPAPSAQSIGRPQDGRLVAGVRLPARPAAYFIRRPYRAWGTTTTVDQVVRAIERVRRRFPRVHPLAVGDISARAGGKITMHGSHQSGRDIDLGFYFRRPPRGYPVEFAVAREDELDFPATWALLSTFAETAGRPGGVERIFLDYSTQAMFWKLARRAKVPQSTLDRWFQYPHGQGADHGIIRHEPGHDEHMHVRFVCPPRDAGCR